MTQLRKLGLSNAAFSSDTLTVLRQMQQLHVLRPPQNVRWSQLLAPGHRLRLREFYDSNDMSQDECDALATLPSLTRVALVRCDCTHVDCITALPLLQSLELLFLGSRVDSPRVVTALRQCTRLTALSTTSWFECHAVFTSEQQLRECVQSMSLLRSFSLVGCRIVPSLSFLASGPITSTLTDLTLKHFLPLLPVAELQHIQQLRALERIELINVFERQLTAVEAEPFTPPSQIMSSLRSFKCQLEWSPSSNHRRRLIV